MYPLSWLGAELLNYGTRVRAELRASAAEQLSAPSQTRCVCTNISSSASTLWGVSGGLDTARDIC